MKWRCELEDRAKSDEVLCAWEFVLESQSQSMLIMMCWTFFDKTCRFFLKVFQLRFILVLKNDHGCIRKRYCKAHFKQLCGDWDFLKIPQNPFWPHSFANFIPQWFVMAMFLGKYLKMCWKFDSSQVVAYYANLNTLSKTWTCACLVFCC